MIILGFDPGTRRIGYAVIKKQRSQLELLTASLITTKSPRSDQQLLELWQATQKLIKKFSPDYLVIEKIFFSQNQKTAMAVAQARGILLLAGASHGCPILEFAPNEIKAVVTGYGHTSKQAIATLAAITLGIESLPGPDDISDAVAIALTGAFKINHTYPQRPGD